MVQNQIHAQIVRNKAKIETWFGKIRTDVSIPFYSSYDIRDSGFKVTNVDANIYPAGFNNICNTDRDNSSALVKQYIDRHYGSQTKRLLILTEEHTNNPYYWDNVSSLQSIIREAGLEVRLAIPRASEPSTFVMNSASRGPIEVHAAKIKDGNITVSDYKPDLIISNNDFSEYYAEWGEVLHDPINPPRELGWYRRKKSTYFKYYNQLATEFANVIEVDPWCFTVETELYSEFDINDEASREGLALRVEQMIGRLRENYARRGIKDDPFVFVKNNSGTYGLAVMRIGSGDDVRSLNNKTRKKMKAAKGGRDVEEVILQEGVPSIVKTEDVTAEPTIYLLGCQLAGGFLRSHKEKGPTESLNSPGAVYKRLCVSDLNISVEGHPMENVYGWCAKLGLLAIGQESQEMGVEYTGYTKSTSCS